MDYQRQNIIQKKEKDNFESDHSKTNERYQIKKEELIIKKKT